MPADRAAVVLLAAGAGRRVGADTNKVLLPLAGVPVFAWSLHAIEQVADVGVVVVVVRAEDAGLVSAFLDERFPSLDTRVVIGGDTRHGSESNALTDLGALIEDGSIDVVAVHDAARPLAPPNLFTAVIAAARVHGGALPVRRLPGLVRRNGVGDPAEAVAGLVGVQTPQAFAARPLLSAYRTAERDGFTGTDTASCIQTYTSIRIRCVPGPATNLKITFPEDVAVAARLL